MSNTIYPEFTAEASCASGILDPEIWFDYETVKGIRGVKHTDASRLAQKICYDCPALRECRKYSMQFDNLYGIWGGLDHVQRENMQKATKAKTIDFILSYPNATQPMRETGQGSTVKINYE